VRIVDRRIEDCGLESSIVDWLLNGESGLLTECGLLVGADC